MNRRPISIRARAAPIEASLCMGPGDNPEKLPAVEQGRTDRFVVGGDPPTAFEASSSPC